MKKCSRQEIKNKVLEAKRLLLHNDQFLLEDDLNERTISHKFAEYLQRQFPDWDVDCEYNRVPRDSHYSHYYHDLEEKFIKKKLGTRKDFSSDAQNNVTYIDTNGRTVYPDIIIHHRNTDDNLLVIEIKKSSRPDKEVSLDKQKLDEFVGEPLCYQHGLFLQIPTGSEYLSNWHFDWFSKRIECKTSWGK